MITLTDLLIDKQKKQEKYYANPLHFGKIIKNIAGSILLHPQVYFFGSCVTKTMRPDSDIDVLIIADDTTHEKRIQIMAKVNAQFNFSHPFELHVITSSDYNNWYKNFIKDVRLPVE